MIVPCIDLMGGKVVQLVQGTRKVLEVDRPELVLEKFLRFPEIQVIDLDAAMGSGSNEELVRFITARAVCRVGGGVRTPERARRLVDQGASKVIVGTAAFDRTLLEEIAGAISPERLIIALDSRGGSVVVKGWRESTGATAEELIPELEPYCRGFLCTYVDKEGMMEGTDLAWFGRLRSRTTRPITAAGGITNKAEIRALQQLNIDAAIGMAIYTGKLDLEELAGEFLPN